MGHGSALRLILGTIRNYQVTDLDLLKERLSLSNADIALLLDLSESSYYRLKKEPYAQLTLGQSLIVDHLTTHFLDPDC